MTVYRLVSIPEPTFYSFGDPAYASDTQNTHCVLLLKLLATKGSWAHLSTEGLLGSL